MYYTKSNGKLTIALQVAVLEILLSKLFSVIDKTDRMHGNAFKNRNTFGDDQETGFVDRVDQDSISKMLITPRICYNEQITVYTDEPIEDGEFAFTNDAFDQDGKIITIRTNSVAPPMGN